MLVNGEPQGSVSNPRRHPNGLLEMVVTMGPAREGVAKLVVRVGQSASRPFSVPFRELRPHAKLLLRICAVVVVALSCLIALLASRRHWDPAAPTPAARARTRAVAAAAAARRRRGLAPSLTERLLEVKEEDLSESGLEEHKVHLIQRHHLVLHSKIARGAFGNVFKGSWLGTVCAVKQAPRTHPPPHN